jgi:hypothetical protein
MPLTVVGLPKYIFGLDVPAINGPIDGSYVRLLGPSIKVSSLPLGEAN